MLARHRPILALAALASALPAGAHPNHATVSAGVPDLVHLLTQPDHLLPLAAVAMVAAIAWRVRATRLRRQRRRRDD